MHKLYPVYFHGRKLGRHMQSPIVVHYICLWQADTMYVDDLHVTCSLVVLLVYCS